jgi:hypothetical protein
MSESEYFVSKRLEDVWAWKDAIYNEVAHLPTEEALAEILKKAHAVSEKYNFPTYNPLHSGEKMASVK